MKSTAPEKPMQARIVVKRRSPPLGEQKVSPIADEEYHETKPSTEAIRIFPSLASKYLPNSEAMQPSSRTTTDKVTKVHTTTTTTPALSELSTRDLKPLYFTKRKKSSGGIKQWYSDLTSRKKTLLRVGIVAGVLLVCAIIIILPLLFFVILRSSSTTTTTTTTTATTTTTSSTVISAYWTFDLTWADWYGVYNGAPMNGANYSVAATNQPYLGNGRALLLSAASNQSYVVSTPFFNLANTSFTVEAWIYPTNITGDRGIFSQCACSTCSDQCFYLILRSDHLYADFTFNGLLGSTTIIINTWYHVAFVYNYETNQQILYVKGVQDAIASNAQPYQGVNTSLQIGAAQVFFSTEYFNGYIDNVKVTTRAKSSTRILFDASVTAYYPFDLSTLNNDNGPNGLNGSSINTAIVNGRVNQAMHFSGSSSYFQAYGFYQLVYSMSNQPFSVSLWINPKAVSTSTIVQITQQQSSGPCFNFIGIYSTNVLTGQLMIQGTYWPIIYGPYLTVNIWTHVSVTYSSINGMTLYVNGVLFGSTGALTLSTLTTITWLQIGYNFPNSLGNIPNGAYQGFIDEVYVHSRELTQADVTALANP